jgi:hypothetical protein
LPVILFRLIFIPLICLVSLSLMAMISTARTKIKAEAGHPCIIPRKTLKITYVFVNNCIYFKYSLCTLKPAEKLSACSPASMP